MHKRYDTSKSKQVQNKCTRLALKLQNRMLKDIHWCQISAFWVVVTIYQNRPKVVLSFFIKIIVKNVSVLKEIKLVS